MTSKQSINQHNFAITLRNARERAGLTQRELGQRAGVNFSQISRYEKGTALPRPGMLNKLAEVLGVSHEFLREGEDLVHATIHGPDGQSIDIAFPAADMEIIRESAERSGRLVEDEIVAFVRNGIRAMMGDFGPEHAYPKPKKPVASQKGKKQTKPVSLQVAMLPASDPEDESDQGDPPEGR